MSADLRAALDAVYAAFSSVKRPGRIDGCEHCGKDYSHLVEQDRSALSADLLFGYAGSVFYTCGSEADFRYFLPRLLELLFAGDGLMPEIVLGKLQHAQWRHWPDDQQRCIETAVRAGLVQSCDASDPNGFDIDAVLCGAFLAGMDLTPLMETVARRPKAVVRCIDLPPSNEFLQEFRMLVQESGEIETTAGSGAASPRSYRESALWPPPVSDRLREQGPG